jgi:hypothetical protein
MQASMPLIFSCQVLPAMDIKVLLVELEVSLHSPMVRKSRQKLESLLSNECLEIGASGKVYGKNEIIDALLKDNETSEIQATDFEFLEYCPGVAQLIYKTRHDIKNEVQYAIRSSIWKLEGAQWRMVFHQGTVSRGS